MRQVNDKLKVWASILDEKAQRQAETTARMSFVYPHLALMPDAHWGMGATVGSVVPTIGHLMPATLGVDIGCGMIAHRTQFVLANVMHRDRVNPLSALREAIEGAIPSSVAHYNSVIQNSALPHIEELEQTAGIAQANTVASNWPYQLGSLGSGNHFIEVTVDEESRVWLFLHSGSRGVGNKLAMKHIQIAKDWTIPGHGQPARYKLEDPNLAFLEEGTQQFSDYLEAVRWAQRFAYLNRVEMMTRLTHCFERWMDANVHVSQKVNCHHNYTEREFHFGNWVWLTRKGAIAAHYGVKGLIPGSMGAASYVVSGLGNPQSFESAPHGAGRLYSRGEAKRKFTLEELTQEMQGIEWNVSPAFLDEAPGAYKPIDQIMEDASDLVKIEHTLHQIVNVKGT